MIRRITMFLIVLTLCSGISQAQYLVVGPGSTIQGDYLRGVGVAAFGMGYYNMATAEANSINVNTAIRLNEYIWACLKNENKENAEFRARVRARQDAAWRAIRERIKLNPEERDVLNGDALNAKLQEILELKIDESSFRSARVPLTADVIRRIPFKIGEEGQVLSIRRLRARGKDLWPVGLQDDAFVAPRRAYEKAVDEAILEQIQGKMSLKAIATVDAAVETLARRVEEDPKIGRGKLYNDAKIGIRELKALTRVFKIQSAEHVMGEMTTFSGTTVHDLLRFMQAHKIRFAVARTPDERRVYVELYTALFRQHGLVSEAALGGGGEPRDAR